MIPKFRFYADEEFTGMYNVVDIDFDEEMLFIEDDKNTSMIEVIEGNYNISTKGFPTYCYGFCEGILMMSTGQFDMEGVEIYEGDIVSYFLGGKSVQVSVDEFIIDDSKPFEDYYINEIVFDGGYFGVKASETLMPIWNSQNKIKVLGNRYENPELLEDLNNGRKLR